MSPPRLDNRSLHHLKPGVAIPAYDRAATAPGIVHFGPGAFMRAHLAAFVDALLPSDPRWGMAGIALRSGADAAALTEQDFLYTLAELNEPARYRVLGAIRDMTVAPADPASAFAHLEHPDARLITITVTEKGYCLDATGALDLRHADVVHDLANSHVPRSLIGWLAEGLSRRHARGFAPPAVMSCDNVASNGPKLRAAVLAFARELNRSDLAAWIEAEVRFPATMVDSITPASDQALRTRVSQATGAQDHAPVQREPFAQWVVEDALGPGAPDLSSVGVQLTGDVHAYEQAKLRLLNGAHSALAYLGLLRGRTTVHETMCDEELATFVERMMRSDTAPTLHTVKGLDVQDYIGTLLARLRNPAVVHRLVQIAADGSLKLPYRFLEPIADLLKLGRPIGRLCIPVAAWMQFICERRGETLNDPMAAKLQAVAHACNGDPAHDVAHFLALAKIFPRDLAQEPRFAAALIRAYAALPSLD